MRGYQVGILLFLPLSPVTFRRGQLRRDARARARFVCLFVNSLPLRTVRAAKFQTKGTQRRETSFGHAGLILRRLQRHRYRTDSNERKRPTAGQEDRLDRARDCQGTWKAMMAAIDNVAGDCSTVTTTRLEEHRYYLQSDLKIDLAACNCGNLAGNWRRSILFLLVLTSRWIL